MVDETGDELPGNQFVFSGFGVVAWLLLLDGKHLTGLPVAAVMSYFAEEESCWSGRVQLSKHLSNLLPSQPQHSQLSGYHWR